MLSKSNSYALPIHEQSRSDAYVASAVRSELGRLAATTSGGRAVASFRAAAALGRMVGAGLLDREATEQALLGAATAAGLPTQEASGHIQNGLRRGEESPASLPTGLMAAPYAPSVTADQTRRRATTNQNRLPSKTAVQDLWALSMPVTADDEAGPWCKSRALDPHSVEDWDLARVIPRESRLPSWARTRLGFWTESGHRLLVPLVDSNGELASIRARAISGNGKPAKSVAPTGFSTAGLVFACPLARQLLAGVILDWWAKQSLVISEGEVDWLTWASRHSQESAEGPAYLGITAGSWTANIASRIPSGSVVHVRTHADAAGRKYASEIARSLVDRCGVQVPAEKENA